MGPIYTKVSTTTYATCPLGQFTEEDDEDEENRGLAIFYVWIMHGLFDTLRFLYNNLTSKKQSQVPRKPRNGNILEFERIFYVQANAYVCAIPT